MRICVLLIVLVVFLCFAEGATTFFVSQNAAPSSICSQSSPCPFSTGYALAISGDTLSFVSGTHNFPTNQILSKSITITGTGRGTTIVQCNVTGYTLFQVASGASVTLSSMTMQGCSGNEGLVNVASGAVSLGMYDCTIQNVRTGPGLSVSPGLSGGTITVTIVSSVFYNITRDQVSFAYGGAAIQFRADPAVGLLSVSGCEFIQNSALPAANNAFFHGGAIYGDASGKVVIASSVFDSNTVVKSFDDGSQTPMGGAVYLTKSASAVISQCIFKNNSAMFGGGGLAMIGTGPASVLSSLFSGNKAVSINSNYGNGAGILIDPDPSGTLSPGPFTFSGLTFRNNYANATGGALAYGFVVNGNPSWSCSQCAFFNNTSLGYGGAIGSGYNSVASYFGSLSLASFCGNKAGGPAPTLGLYDFGCVTTCGGLNVASFQYTTGLSCYSVSSSTKIVTSTSQYFCDGTAPSNQVNTACNPFVSTPADTIVAGLSTVTQVVSTPLVVSKGTSINGNLIIVPGGSLSVQPGAALQVSGVVVIQSGASLQVDLGLNVTSGTTSVVVVNAGSVTGNFASVTTTTSNPCVTVTSSTVTSSSSSVTALVTLAPTQNSGCTTAAPSGGLTGGQIAGIVIGVIVGGILIALLIVFLTRHFMRKRDQEFVKRMRDSEFAKAE